MALVGLWQLASGLSGDMWLGTLVDAGVPIQVMNDAVEAVTDGQISLRASEVKRGAFRAMKVDVMASGTVILESGGPPDGSSASEAQTLNLSKAPNTFVAIKERLETAALSTPVQEKAIAVFSRLAEAEAHVHGSTLNHVHFHELGTWDALADIVGSVAGFEALKLDALYHDAIHVGGGTVATSHGVVPVPAPATAHLLTGRELVFEPGRGELVTPTGAALLVTLAQPSPPRFRFAPQKTAVGAGTRNPKGWANVSRLSLGQRGGGLSVVGVIEATVDDMLPEDGGYLIESFLDAGALDVTLTPTLMKKSRPGFLIRLIVPENQTQEFAKRLVGESSSLGARVRLEERYELPRAIETVHLPEGSVRIKVAETPSGKRRPHVEYEDLKTLASKRGVPIQDLRREVERLWESQT